MAGSRPGRRLFGASVVVAASLVAFGLQPVMAAPGSITLYSAQHEQVVDMLTAQFTKETGIAVRVHKGEGPELASQLLAEGTHFSDVVTAIRALGIREVVSIEAVDLFRGKNVPTGQYSLLVRVTFQSRDATLTEVQLTDFSARIVAALQQRLGAQRRAG